MIRAAIDIGSNSILLLIAEVNGEEIKVIDERFYAPRLGKGLDDTGLLADEAMNRALLDLGIAVGVCDEYEVEHIVAGATAAVREAGNGLEYVDRIKADIGLDVKILTGEQEAELTYIGGVSGKNVQGPAALIDTGGASTEIIIGDGACPTNVVSVPVGAVRFAERFGKSPAGEARAIRWLEDQLRPSALVIRDRRVIGVGGTVTTLAAVQLELEKYDAARVNEVILSIEQIDALIEKFGDLEVEEIAELPGMEPSRADIIEAGATIIRTFMKLSSAERIEISARGLRYGLLLERSV